MKILGIDHVGMAPKDCEKAQEFFQTLLQLSSHGQEYVKEQKTLTTVISASNADPESFTRLELLSILPGEQGGPIGKFLEKRGAGIHHLALRVDNIQQALEELDKQGVELIDKSPRSGTHGTQIAFIHPRSTGGILIELVEGCQE